MSATRVDKLVVSFGAVFASYVCYVLVMMNDPAVLSWNIAYGILFAALWICVWGLLRLKKWAYILSFVFAGLGLGLGAYLAHFAWTFWIFKEPTLAEKVLAVIHPRISVFTLAPALWLGYFLKSSVRARFVS
ncbi:MAG TPA: hypothetical protein PLY88_06845 [Candidatus Omnitrophota bacterium]|nr:hypothetical protein [Candidatus Omnitrophota bacterium]